MLPDPLPPVPVPHESVTWFSFAFCSSARACEHGLVSLGEKRGGNRNADCCGTPFVGGTSHSIREPAGPSGAHGSGRLPHHVCLSFGPRRNPRSAQSEGQTPPTNPTKTPAELGAAHTDPRLLPPSPHPHPGHPLVSDRGQGAWVRSVERCFGDLKQKSHRGFSLWLI